MADILNDLFLFDVEKRKAFPILCGVDEAGRGSLCGPVCASAVILDPDNLINGINDSKAINEKKRNIFFEEIKLKALAYSVVFIGEKDIDKYNILNATMIAMKKSVEELSLKPDLVIIDGNRCPEININCEAVVKGDAKSASIAAASILAKVSRDNYMMELDKKHPEYKLAKHKGYPTKEHYEILDKYGVKEFYRRSFLIKRGYVDEI